MSIERTRRRASKVATAAALGQVQLAATLAALEPPTSSGSHPPPALREAQPFWRSGAPYFIAPGTTASRLVSDGALLLSSARGVLDELAIESDALFAVLHLMAQAECLVCEAAELLAAEDRRREAGA